MFCSVGARAPSPAISAKREKSFCCAPWIEKLRACGAVRARARALPVFIYLARLDVSRGQGNVKRKCKEGQDDTGNFLSFFLQHVLHITLRVIAPSTSDLFVESSVSAKTKAQVLVQFGCGTRILRVIHGRDARATSKLNQHQSSTTVLCDSCRQLLGDGQ